jgi:tight adherence protein B
MLIGFALFVLTFMIAVAAVACAAFALEAFRRVRGTDPEQAPESASPLLRDTQLSSISLWAMALQQMDVAEKLRQAIARAGLTWSVGRVTLLMLLCGSVAGAIAARVSWLPAWTVILCAIAAGLAPWFYVRWRGTKRLRRFEEQFPDALDTLARAMRAGHPFSGALEATAAEAQEPVAGEIHRLCAEGRLATSWSDALASFAARVPLLEVNMFVSAVSLHLRTGGKLTQLIEQLSENMREVVALKGEVRAAAAHGKLTGAVLTALPIVIAIALMVVNPSYLAVLVAYPWGKDLLCAGAVSLIAAHLVIRKMVDIKV